MRTSISAPAGGIRSFPVTEATTRTVVRRVSWLVPDLALSLAALTLFYSLFLAGGYQSFFHDSDAGWHIRTGELILQTHSLPRTDPFSFTQTGQPWFAWEWLADAAVAAIHSAAGLSGVALFYAAALAAGVWIWVRFNWTAGGNFLLTALFASPMLSTTDMHWLARPHLLSWIFLLLTVRFAIRPRFTPAALTTIAGLSCLWANLHASFLMAPAILLLYAAGAALPSLLFSGDPAESRSHMRGFLFAAAAALGGTLLNPYGIALHRHVILYLTDGALLDRVGEFQSFNFHLAGSGQILLALGLAAVGGVLSLARKELGSFLLICFLFACALRSARGLPLLALLALPLANGAITQSLRSANGLRTSFRSFLESSLRYSDGLRAIDRRSNGFVWVPLLLLIAAFGLRQPAVAANTGFPPAEFPVAAASAIAKLPTEARLLASDKFGGYLIYRFAGSRKVFFDGRSDLYGAQFLKDYANLTQLRPGWRITLDRYRFTHALLPTDAPLIEALESLGWTPLHHDAVATLLARTSRN